MKFSGPRIPMWSLVAICSAMIGVYLFAGVNEATVRMIVRMTARTSVVLFLCGLADNAVFYFWKSGLTGWLAENRGYFILGFLYSHLVHLANVIALSRFTPRTLVRGRVGTGIIIFTVAYGISMAFAARDLRRAAEWLDRRQYALGQLVLLYLVWLVFVSAYLPRVLHSWAFIPVNVALQLALLLHAGMAVSRKLTRAAGAGRA